MKFIPTKIDDRDGSLDAIKKAILEIIMEAYIGAPDKAEFAKNLLIPIIEFAFERGEEFGEATILNKFWGVSNNAGPQATLKDVINIITPNNKKN